MVATAAGQRPPKSVSLRETVLCLDFGQRTLKGKPGRPKTPTIPACFGPVKQGKAWYKSCWQNFMQKVRISITRDFIILTVFIIMVKVKRPFFTLRKNVAPMR
jgi:hypothetical protein